MAKYIRKPIIIEAVRWFKPGDIDRVKTWGIPKKCIHFGDNPEPHGWVETNETGVLVCPGDYIVSWGNAKPLSRAFCWRLGLDI